MAERAIPARRIMPARRAKRPRQAPHLPLELLWKIFMHLSTKDLFLARRVSKFWGYAMTDERIQQKLFLQPDNRFELRTAILADDDETEVYERTYKIKLALVMPERRHRFVMDFVGPLQELSVGQATLYEANPLLLGTSDFDTASSQHGVAFKIKRASKSRLGEKVPLLRPLPSRDSTDPSLRNMQITKPPLESAWLQPRFDSPADWANGEQWTFLSLYQPGGITFGYISDMIEAARKVHSSDWGEDKPIELILGDGNIFLTMERKPVIDAGFAKFHKLAKRIGREKARSLRMCLSRDVNRLADWDDLDKSIQYGLLGEILIGNLSLQAASRRIEEFEKYRCSW